MDLCPHRYPTWDGMHAYRMYGWIWMDGVHCMHAYMDLLRCGSGCHACMDGGASHACMHHACLHGICTSKMGWDARVHMDGWMHAFHVACMRVISTCMPPQACMRAVLSRPFC
jgi:hypothetical protein